ncbi:hypothetical protein PDESU_05801 [Pontiella desulfatans]|uniref:Uncharacterized protein n=1 Tax=Pontiella desulfatans TaxID=2750659 RepID=A0A6C2UB04_PONDE|nr:hypothetical protein [Pontiella desulfatans]VGO17205.1 hypothetical protein PDESU_05801 [Pontiella desulfatans]
MNHKIIPDQQIPPQTHARGRGHIIFPEFLGLTCSKDGTKGDCLIYPDTPQNRKRLVQAKCRYNRRHTGSFADCHFVHRYEIHRGEPVIVIQRIV